MVWTRGAAVCVVLFVLPACTGEETAIAHLPHLKPGSPAAAPTPSSAHDVTPSTTVPTSVPPFDGGTGDTPPPTEDASPPLPRDGGLPAEGGEPVPAGAPDQGFAALSWESMPVLGSSAFRLISSYDRDEQSTFPFVAAGNKDFNNWIAVCGETQNTLSGFSDGSPCDPGLHGYLIASDDSGPGFVSRIFYTHKDLDSTASANERIRIYVDDLTTPAYEGALSDWQNGAPEPFVEPLVEWTSGALVSYVPISYQSKLRILLDDLTPTSGYFYQVDVRSSGPTARFTPAKLESVGSLGGQLERDAKIGTGRAVWTNDQWTVPAGKTVHLLDRTGSGTLGSIRITVDAAMDVLADTELDVTWDDAATPAIALPIGWLFGQRPAPSAFDTLPMTVRLVDKSVELTLSLPMPFSSHAQIDAVNRGKVSHDLKAQLEGVKGHVEGAGYLHATLQEARAPMAADARFPVATLRGRGRYIGSVLFLQGRANAALLVSDPLNFLEGDDVLTVDGRVAGNGTGTEDFLDGGWYFENGLFSSPFAALLAKTDSTTQTMGQITAVRWQVLADAVDFDKSLDLTLEYGAHASSTATYYSSVGFYYLSDPSTPPKP
jgi:hypothetical protein